MRSSNETLLVDSGNTLFKTNKPFTVSSSEHSNARGIAQIYAEMGYDAVNIGMYDLAAGLSFIQDLFFLPWISANYYDGSGQPLFKPYVIKSTTELNVGIIGLSPYFGEQTSDIHYRPWQEVLPALLAELDQKTDMIVILSSLEMTENEIIATNFPSIRVIFTAVQGNRFSNIQEKNRAILTQTKDRGRYLGYLFLQNPQLQVWQERSKVQDDEKQQRTLQYRLERIEVILQRHAQISETRRNGLVKEREGLQLQLKNLESKGKEVGASYFYRNIPILQNIKSNAKIEKLQVSIKEEMQNANASK